MAEQGSEPTEGKCQYRSKLDPHYRCKEPPEPGKDLCIFHDPNPNKDKEKFKRKLQEQIAGKRENHKYSFVGYQFPDGWGKWAEVLKDKTFEEDADFSGAKFLGNADFVTTKFSGDANFTKARFSGYAHFTAARFSKDAHANFTGATFNGVVDFTLAKFSSAVIFTGAIFLSSAFFIGSRNNLLFESGVYLNGIHLTEPERVTFNHVNLSQCKFRGTDVREIDFVDIRWAEKWTAPLD